MKVLQINAVYGISSTGRTTKELDDGLRERKIESIVATTKTNVEKDDLYIIGNRFDWKLHGLLSRVFGKQGYFSSRSTGKLLSYITDERPDVVHLRNLHGNYVNLPMLLRYLAKNDIATVITLHDCWFFTGKCTHYIDKACNKWQTGCYNCPKLHVDNKSWFFDRTKKVWVDKNKLFNEIPRLAVVGVSNWTANEAKKSFLKDSKVVKRIYNWVDLDTFCPHESNILEKDVKDKFVILGVASHWSKSKGLDDFDELSKKLDDKFQIVLVGEFDCKNNNRIVYLPPTSSKEELSDLYAAANVFFNPSKMETFGKVTAEALSCGTPVIVYDSTACSELVGEGCGFVEEVGNIDAVYNDIVLMEHEKKNRTAACRKFAQDNFDKDKLIDEYVDLYRKLIE